MTLEQGGGTNQVPDNDLDDEDDNDEDDGGECAHRLFLGTRVYHMRMLASCVSLRKKTEHLPRGDRELVDNFNQSFVICVSIVGHICQTCRLLIFSPHYKSLVLILIKYVRFVKLCNFRRRR